MITEKLNLFLYFIDKRFEAYNLKKENKKTDDSIISSHHFTNISRKLDRFTVNLYDKLRKQGKRTIIFNVFFHRLCSSHKTLQNLGIIRDWKARKAEVVKYKQENRGFYTGRFTRAIKFQAFIDTMDTIDRDKFKIIGGIKRCKTEEEIFKYLMQYKGIGPFMSWQILCDLKLLNMIKEREDSGAFVHIGQGSRWGYNLMFKNEDVKLKNLQLLLQKVNERMKDKYILNVEDLEHSLCEFYKYNKYADRRVIANAQEVL